MSRECTRRVEPFRRENYPVVLFDTLASDATCGRSQMANNGFIFSPSVSAMPPPVAVPDSSIHEARCHEAGTWNSGLSNAASGSGAGSCGGGHGRLLASTRNVQDHDWVRSSRNAAADASWWRHGCRREDDAAARGLWGPPGGGYG